MLRVPFPGGKESLLLLLSLSEAIPPMLSFISGQEAQSPLLPISTQELHEERRAPQHRAGARQSSPHTSLPALHPSTAGGEHPEGENSRRQLGLSLVGPELKV